MEKKHQGPWLTGFQQQSALCKRHVQGDRDATLRIALLLRDADVATVVARPLVVAGELRRAARNKQEEQGVREHPAPNFHWQKLLIGYTFGCLSGRRDGAAELLDASIDERSVRVPRLQATVTNRA